MIPPCKPSDITALTTNQQQLEDEAQFAILAKALSHPARVRILHILIRLEKLGGCLNGDLVAQLGLAQSTVSEHLRILKVSGLIDAHAIPPKVCYRINTQGIAQFKELLTMLTE